MANFKNKPKPTIDPFVVGAQKIYPVDIELESNEVHIVTKGRTPKGDGLTTLGFVVQEVWMDENGNIIVYADPEKQIKGKQYNKYGDEITKADLTNKKILERAKKE